MSTNPTTTTIHHNLRSANRHATTTRNALNQPRAHAFTLVELLVVTSILVILLAVSVPAFTVLVRTSERSLAEIRVTNGLRSARDAAITQGPGRDTAAVFFFDYEPGGVGRVSIVTCVNIGAFDDLNSRNQPIRRDIFVPVRDIEPVQLPPGTAVRAFGPPGMINEVSARPGIDGDNSLWMSHAANRYNDRRGNWIFPESGFFDTQLAAQGQRRHTFMVRFAGGTGNILTGPLLPAIVVSPAPTTSANWRNQAPYTNAPILSNADSLDRWAAGIINTPRFNLANQRQLIGERSPDTVLAMPVNILAVYDERELASAMGVRTDRGTRTVLEFDGQNTRFVQGNVNAERINNWIWGDSDLSGAVRGSDNPAATILTFDRYTGLVIAAGIAIDGQEGN